MKLNETLNKILANTEETLDKMTGETPESRAAVKEKFKSFIKKLMCGEGDVIEEEEKKDENNN